MGVLKIDGPGGCRLGPARVMRFEGISNQAHGHSSRRYRFYPAFASQYNLSGPVLVGRDNRLGRATVTRHSRDQDTRAAAPGPRWPAGGGDAVQRQRKAGLMRPRCHASRVSNGRRTPGAIS